MKGIEVLDIILVFNMFVVYWVDKFYRYVKLINNVIFNY